MQVDMKYRALAKAVMLFEKQWYNHWQDTAPPAAMICLKQPNPGPRP